MLRGLKIAHIPSLGSAPFRPASKRGNHLPVFLQRVAVVIIVGVGVKGQDEKSDNNACD